MLGALSRGRRMAEKLMTDTCVIRRATGEMVENPDFTVSPAYETVYTGKCRAQTYEGHETTLTAAEGTNVVQRSTVQLPVGEYSPRPGDIVTFTSSHDPLLVGRHFRIVQRYPVKSHATAYRVFVDENVTENLPPLG